jgi:hypothetical protein
MRLSFKGSHVFTSSGVIRQRQRQRYAAPEGAQRVKGTNKAHENGEAMGFVGVRLTVMLGLGYWL